MVIFKCYFSGELIALSYVSASICPCEYLQSSVNIVYAYLHVYAYAYIYECMWNDECMRIANLACMY